MKSVEKGKVSVELNVMASSEWAETEKARTGSATRTYAAFSAICIVFLTGNLDTTSISVILPVSCPKISI